MLHCCHQEAPGGKLTANDGVGVAHARGTGQRDGWWLLWRVQTHTRGAEQCTQQTCEHATDREE